MEIIVSKKPTLLPDGSVKMTYTATPTFSSDEDEDVEFAQRRCMDAVGDMIVEDACKHIKGKYAPNEIYNGISLFYHTSMLPDMVIAGKNAVDTLLSKLIP